MKLNLRLAKAESLVRPVYSIHTLFERVKYDSGEVYSTSTHGIYTCSFLLFHKVYTACFAVNWPLTFKLAACI